MPDDLRNPKPTPLDAAPPTHTPDLSSLHALSGSHIDRRAARRPDLRTALTRRSIALGLLLVVLIAGFAPYNDYILQNSPFIGNHFPIGIIFLMTLLVLVVNPILTLLRKTPFSTGELVAVVTMMLVASAVPSSGLMRYLEPMLLSPYRLVQESPWLKPIANLMPAWLVPTKDPNSPLISNYWLGIDPNRGGSIPILPFIIPKLLWGILIAAILSMALFLAALFRKQWVHNERLSYPLATIPMELLATPEPGRLFNRLWRNPVLWTGAAIPILVYTLAGLHDQYAAVPYIKLDFDFREAFTEKPWNAVPYYITSGRLFLAVVGICFFIPSEIAFSLWLFLLINGALRVLFSESAFDPGQHEAHRGMGIYLGYFAGLLWLARFHFQHVIRAAIANEPRDENEPASYRTLALGYLISSAVAVVWLIAVGMNPLLAILLLFLGTVLITLMSRIVAETGLFFVGPMWWPNDFMKGLLTAKLMSTTSMLWTQIVSRVFFADLRETLMPFATNALRMGQEIPSAQRSRWFKYLFLALALSLLVSGAMHHYLSYTYGREAIGDRWASVVMPFNALQETYIASNSAASTSGDGTGTAWLHLTLGALLVLGAMVGRIMFVAWPFHPIGLVLMGSWPLQVFWFSIFLGWAIKITLLRYGGAQVFRRARPFFIGLIVGEILSAGAWMFVGLVTSGHVRFTLLPG